MELAESHLDTNLDLSIYHLLSFETSLSPLTPAAGDVPRTGRAADVGPVRVCA